MKKRIKTDTTILAGIILLTIVLFFFPNLYPRGILVDNIFDFIGIVLVYKGILFRMAARGHKKNNSEKGQALVTEGLYSLARNPMYLGTFLIGAGFVLLVWPSWMLPIFTVVFYLRFKVQIKNEEIFLKETFGQEYENYCKNVPRLFPHFKNALQARLKEVFNIREAFNSKERRALLTIPLSAVVLESFQELIVYRKTDLNITVLTFLVAFGVMILFFAIKFLIDEIRYGKTPKQT